MTVRDLIKSMQVEILKTDLQPDRAAELLTKLASLMGNTLDEIRESDHDYAVVLLKCLDSDEAANRAKIRAETTPEYDRRRQARDTKELVIELIRSLKFFLTAKREEFQTARHQ